MTYSKIALSALAAAAITFTGCGGGSSSSPTDPVDPVDPIESEILVGEITENKTLTADTNWMLEGKVVVADGVTLTVEAGTTVAGQEGTDAWLMVMPGAKLVADGTAANPIVF
ncbi:MAG: hypothetical protein U9O24_07995, partial [Campylobacterota bacterium]|nr:hypothetical protein [Campylobacterota bacterium]